MHNNKLVNKISHQYEVLSKDGESKSQLDWIEKHPETENVVENLVSEGYIKSATS